ncbi:MAG: class I SAM-dependent RNA methyltransferase [Ruminococcaceae bacterium]|nr:class I SAM-dependent RNA methyltransferase [Oscillospiraceae bacterium]
MSNFLMLAPCMFGVEGILADELKRLDIKNISPENGRVFFEGDENTLATANIFSRTAERVLLVTGRFNAISFEDLFQAVKKINWEDYIGKDDAFPVTGYSINSALHSIPDCQAIIKKAIVERLKQCYKIDWFKETGPVHKIRFSIQKDNVVIAIDTSGEGLHKRGYRAHSLEAPIKETLAAAMCYQARIFPDTVLYDPFCGSGTILVEAALIAKNIAPGLKRNFAAERFGDIYKKTFVSARANALNLIKPNVEFRGIGSDIEKDAVKLTLENAKKAGVGDLITASVKDIADFNIAEDRAIVITNPPYGERLLEIKEAEELYKTMGKVMPMERGKKYFVICPNDDFESRFGRPADKRRKLYNGMIKCQLYSYFKTNFAEKE